MEPINAPAIRYWMCQTGVKQGELAAMAGINRAYFCQLLTKKLAGPNSIYRIEKVVGFSIRIASPSGGGVPGGDGDLPPAPEAPVLPPPPVLPSDPPTLPLKVEDALDEEAVF